MSKIPAVKFNSVEHAIKHNFVDMASIKLKDGSSLKIMCNANNLDAFVLNKGDVIGARGYQGKPEFIENSLINLLNRMQKHIQKGKNIFDEYYNSLVKVENVK